MKTVLEVAVAIANDAAPRVVAIQSPANASTVGGSVTVSSSATDNQNVAKISLSIVGREVAVSYASSLSCTRRTSSTSTKKRGRQKFLDHLGLHTLIVAAMEAAGNIASQSIEVKSQ